MLMNNLFPQLINCIYEKLGAIDQVMMRCTSLFISKNTTSPIHRVIEKLIEYGDCDGDCTKSIEHIKKKNLLNFRHCQLILRNSNHFIILQDAKIIFGSFLSKEVGSKSIKDLTILQLFQEELRIFAYNPLFRAAFIEYVSYSNLLPHNSVNKMKVLMQIQDLTSIEIIEFRKRQTIVWEAGTRFFPFEKHISIRISM